MKLYGWEGSRWSGVALAMRYGLRWFVHLRAQGLGKVDERLCGALHSVLLLHGYGRPME